jgi:hypothetical protein
MRGWKSRELGVEGIEIDDRQVMICIASDFWIQDFEYISRTWNINSPELLWYEG